ncbi:hypothetical protein [Methylobacterium sp. J-067]|uniref:hypothetical protein n=1 Tax=Methylobacterium sp. J-067 TaxID=2836648 RepID=UPI001FB89297|nr:hypothetical protein [Methylobacterium sp. J-067]MCJ2024472.1 hypothetical protein [Methylobacterium sp. J-067]
MDSINEQNNRDPRDGGSPWNQSKFEPTVREIDLTPSYQDALRLAKLRIQAKSLGLRLSKSRWHQPYLRNRGGLVILDSQDTIVAGAGYSLDLASVEKILSVMADQMPQSMLQLSERMDR